MAYSLKWHCEVTGPDLKSRVKEKRRHSSNTGPWRPLIMECRFSPGCFSAEEAGTVVPRETDSSACFQAATTPRYLRRLWQARKSGRAGVEGQKTTLSHEALQLPEGQGGFSTLCLSPTFILLLQGTSNSLGRASRLGGGVEGGTDIPL